MLTQYGAITVMPPCGALLLDDLINLASKRLEMMNSSSNPLLWFVLFSQIILQKTADSTNTKTDREC